MTRSSRRWIGLCNTRRSFGFTLVETTVALLASSVLLVGMSSALFIAVTSLNSNLTPAPAAIRGSELLTNLRFDLQGVVTMSERTPTAVTASVPDRTGDSVAETIRYSWSGLAGDPLLRQFNGGTPRVVAENVRSFSLTYQPAAATRSISVRIQTSTDPRSAVETAFPLFNRP